MVVVAVVFSDTSDEEYISTYRCPEPNTDGTVLLASISGFCTPDSIIQATTDLRCVMCMLKVCVSFVKYCSVTFERSGTWPLLTLLA